MIALVKEFCKESSLHGLLPIVLSESSRRERLFWACIFSVTAVVFVSQVYQLATLISHSPVEMIVDNPNYDLKHVEFPAVTVCSNSKVMRSKLVSYVAKLQLSPNDTDRYYNTILAMDLLRYPFYYFPSRFIDEIINGSVFPIEPEDITDIMEKVKPQLDEIFKNCRWNGQPRRCRLLFRPQVTEEGFCYSFNSKTAERTRFDPPSLPPIALPDGSLECLRNNIAGRGVGLFFELSYLGNELFEEHFIPRGYSVVIHNPNSYPDISHKYSTFFKNFSYSRFSISVSTVKADESLSRVSDESRGCELEQRANDYACYYKCRMTEMLRECGCLPYFMSAANPQANICGLDELQCLMDNNVKLRNPFSEEDSNDGIPQWSIPEVMNCSCSFPCHQTTYRADHISVLREEEDGILGFTKALSSVEVTYESPFATSYIKRASFTVFEFLVAVGGVGGLLLGCSLISFVEIVILAYKLAKEAYFQLVIKKNIIYPFNE